MNINIDILEPRDVQGGIDVISSILKDDVAALTASFKGPANSRGIVRIARPASFDYAFLSVVRGGGSQEKTGPYNSCEAHLVDDRCKT